MPFVPATGSNSDTANSYCDVAYADAYHTLRGNTLWTGTEPQKQAALIKATDYIEQVYSQRFIGIYSGVGLAWPRSNLSQYASDVIPDNLKKATCELALEALAGDLNPATGGSQNVIREKVDVIEIEYDKAITSKSRPAVTGYLSSLISGSALNRPVVRV
ncbi:DnaT-like ssDNA-binding protein [Dyadobacter sp. CY323]|uniref:DnaT-like ssDNA-binding protein n=1 Tax=Dyadobacter sp. CY323 TaxID=2907302 RepID=UPI001F2787B0|nr:DnaT-like ssDNA-binding protein [Dyadobacter sp. CY323]MCE6993058.1 hypothetical protein [Dyadobacter sp. CY323]